MALPTALAIGVAGSFAGSEISRRIAKRRKLEKLKKGKQDKTKRYWQRRTNIK